MPAIDYITSWPRIEQVSAGRGQGAPLPPTAMATCSRHCKRQSPRAVLLVNFLPQDVPDLVRVEFFWKMDNPDSPDSLASDQLTVDLLSPRSKRRRAHDADADGRRTPDLAKNNNNDVGFVLMDGEHHENGDDDDEVGIVGPFPGGLWGADHRVGTGGFSGGYDIGGALKFRGRAGNTAYPAGGFPSSPGAPTCSGSCRDRTLKSPGDLRFAAFLTANYEFSCDVGRKPVM